MEPAGAAPSVMSLATNGEGTRVTATRPASERRFFVWLIGLQALTCVVFLGSATYWTVTTRRLAKKIDPHVAALSAVPGVAPSAAGGMSQQAATLQSLVTTLEQVVNLYASERAERADLAAELKRQLNSRPMSVTPPATDTGPEDAAQTNGPVSETVPEEGKRKVLR